MSRSKRTAVRQASSGTSGGGRCCCRIGQWAVRRRSRKTPPLTTLELVVNEGKNVAAPKTVAKPRIREHNELAVCAHHYTIFCARRRDSINAAIGVDHARIRHPSLDDAVLTGDKVVGADDESSMLGWDEDLGQVENMPVDAQILKVATHASGGFVENRRVVSGTKALKQAHQGMSGQEGSDTSSLGAARTLHRVSSSNTGAILGNGPVNEGEGGVLVFARLRAGGERKDAKGGGDGSEEPVAMRSEGGSALLGSRLLRPGGEANIQIAPLTDEAADQPLCEGLGHARDRLGDSGRSCPLEIDSQSVGHAAMLRQSGIRNNPPLEGCRGATMRETGAIQALIALGSSAIGNEAVVIQAETIGRTR